MVTVTTGIERKLEQKAVAADRLAISADLVPVGSKHRTRLFLLHTARSSSKGDARTGMVRASTMVLYCNSEAIFLVLVEGGEKHSLMRCRLET